MKWMIDKRKSIGNRGLYPVQSKSGVHHTSAEKNPTCQNKGWTETAGVAFGSKALSSWMVLRREFWDG